VAGVVKLLPPGAARPSLRLPWLSILGVLAIVIATAAIVLKNLPTGGSDEILNVSYDPTRELYSALDKEFVAEYHAHSGNTLHIKESHGGSGRQLRSVLDGSQKPASCRWP
jgi:sulfate transport system substrate-binding protein